MFIEEKVLKEKFWENYKNRKGIVAYQFENALRKGNCDLLTLEVYQEKYQINAFEFKLNDIKKVLAQAEANLPYANKSWVVVPIEKEQLIKDKYMNYLTEKKYIGVMGVEAGGRWIIIHQPKIQQDIKLSQEVLAFIINGK